MSPRLTLHQFISLNTDVLAYVHITTENAASCLATAAQTSTGIWDSITEHFQGKAIVEGIAIQQQELTTMHSFLANMQQLANYLDKEAEGKLNTASNDLHTAIDTCRTNGFRVHNNWTIEDTTTVTTTERKSLHTTLANDLHKAYVAFTAIDQEIAQKIRSIIDSNWKDYPRAGDPDAPYRDANGNLLNPQPTIYPHATARELGIHFAEDPPSPFGPNKDKPNYDRNQAWRNYLSKHAGDDTRELYLPDPNTPDLDPQLKLVGVAGYQLGMQYAWGGGHGIYPGPTRGEDDPRDGTDEKGNYKDHDHDYTGLDCSGFMRYCTYLVYGKDPSDSNGYSNTRYMYQMARSHNKNSPYTTVAGDPQPGDMMLCEGYKDSNGNIDFQHVQIYIGIGPDKKPVYISAPGSNSHIKITHDIPGLPYPPMYIRPTGYGR